MLRLATAETKVAALRKQLDHAEGHAEVLQSKAQNSDAKALDAMSKNKKMLIELDTADTRLDEVELELEGCLRDLKNAGLR